MALVCVDASFVLAWLLPSEQNPAVSQRMLAYFRGDDEFIAPPLLMAEVVSTLRRWVHRGELTPLEGRSMVDAFLSLGIAIQDSPDLYLRAYDLATTYNQSRAYDACYLALAETLSCDLLTLDQRLYRAVAADFPRVRLVRA